MAIKEPTLRTKVTAATDAWSGERRSSVRARAERFSGSFVVDRMGIGFGKQVFQGCEFFPVRHANTIRRGVAKNHRSPFSFNAHFRRHPQLSVPETLSRKLPRRPLAQDVK